MFTLQQDVIYARKYGTALTMHVYSPTGNPNGIGIIFVMSGGWRSSHEPSAEDVPGLFRPFLEHGYTVFAVVHGCQPKFTLPEIVQDIHTAVRYIRHHAAEFAVDPDRLGITGHSAGGHLSLMIGFSGGPGDPEAAREEDRASSRVQAVAEFYGPSDFLNYGAAGEPSVGENILANYQAPFDFHEWDEVANKFVAVTDRARRFEIAAEVSPVTHITADAPPVLMIHGDADEIVPLYQSQIVAARLAELGVPHRLITVPGEAHGWEDMSGEMLEEVAWFDTHLLGK